MACIDGLGQTLPLGESRVLAFFLEEGMATLLPCLRCLAEGTKELSSRVADPSCMGLHFPLLPGR